MPTMIQAPDIVGTEVSGLQPVMRPSTQSGLGSFLQGLMPAVSTEIEKYQDENQQKNIALGMNDELNKVHRDVSWLDRRNYEYGHQYQFVQNGQAALQKKFSEDVGAIKTTDSDAATKVFDIGRQYMDATVTNIHESSLPSELKESLYKSTMKENAVYQQMINKKLQQLTADAAYKTRTVMSQGLARDLNTKEFDTESLIVQVQSFREKVTGVMQGSVVQVWDDSTKQFVAKAPSAEDINKEVSLLMKAAFTNTLDNLKASGTGADLARMQQLADVADSMIDVDLELSTYIKGKVSEFQSQVERNNDSYKSREVAQTISDWELNPESLTVDVLNTHMAAMTADDSLSIDARTANIKSYLSAYESINKAKLSAKATDITLFDTPDQYEGIGKSPEAWAKDWVEYYQKNNQGNPTKAGLEIMYKAKGAGENSPAYSADLMKRGSEILFRSMIGAVNMTDAEAKDDTFYEQRNAAFAETARMYKQYKLNNGSAAIDMLSGIDDKYRSAFETVMENGGTLAQVREAFKAPVQMNDAYKYFDTARDGVTAELLGLRKEVLGGAGGTRFKNMADNLEPAYVDMYKEVLNTSKHSFVSNVRGTSAYSLLGASKGTLLMDSPSGYSSTLTPSRARQAIRGFKITGTNEPLGEQYVGKAIDAQREAIAKQYDVRPDNVIVRIDDTGQTAQFYAYSMEKTWGGIREGEHVLANGNANGVLSGGVVTMARIKKEAEAIHKVDRTPTPAKAAQQVSGNYVAGASVRVHGTRRNANVKINAQYANGLGGNVDVARKWVNHMSTYEGFVINKTDTKDQNTGKQSSVYAMGVLTRTAKNYGMVDKFEAAKGDPQKLMDLQGELVNKFYTDKSLDMAGMYKKVGIPAVGSGAYPARYEQSMMLLLDGAWHGWRGALDKPAKGRSSLVDAMNAPNIQKGLALLENTSIYDRKNRTGNLRNKWLEDALRAHHRNR